MATIVLTPAHFQGPLSVGLNTSASAPQRTQTAALETLSAHIRRYEPEWLGLFLGGNAYALFLPEIKYMQGDGAEDESTFRSLQERQSDSEEIAGWAELYRCLRGTLDGNPLAAYVYFQILTNYRVTETGVGVSQDGQVQRVEAMQRRAWGMQRDGSLKLAMLMERGGMEFYPDPCLFETVNSMGI